MFKSRLAVNQASLVKYTSTEVHLRSDPTRFRNTLLLLGGLPFIFFCCILFTGASVKPTVLLAGFLPFGLLTASAVWLMPAKATLKIDAKRQRISGNFIYLFGRQRRLNLAANRFEKLLASPNDSTVSMQTIGLIGSESSLGISFYNNFKEFKTTKQIIGKLRLAKRKASKTRSFDQKAGLLMVVCYSLIGTGILLFIATLIGAKINFYFVAFIVATIVRQFHHKPKESKRLALSILLGIYLLFWIPVYPAGLLFLSVVDIGLAFLSVHLFMLRIPAFDSQEARRYTNPPVAVMITSIILATAVIAYGLLTWSG